MMLLDKQVILPGQNFADSRLGVFAAGPDDAWRGFLVAERRWDGTGVLPSPPASTERGAMVLYQRQIQRQGQRLAGQPADRSPAIMQGYGWQ